MWSRATESLCAEVSLWSSPVLKEHRCDFRGLCISFKLVGLWVHSTVPKCLQCCQDSIDNGGISSAKVGSWVIFLGRSPALPKPALNHELILPDENEIFYRYTKMVTGTQRKLAVGQNDSRQGPDCCKPTAQAGLKEQRSSFCWKHWITTLLILTNRYLHIKLCYRDNIQADTGLQEEVECFSSFAWQQNEQRYIQGAIEL